MNTEYRQFTTTTPHHQFTSVHPINNPIQRFQIKIDVKKILVIFANHIARNLSRSIVNWRTSLWDRNTNYKKGQSNITALLRVFKLDTRSYITLLPRSVSSSLIIKSSPRQSRSSFLPWQSSLLDDLSRSLFTQLSQKKEKNLEFWLDVKAFHICQYNSPKPMHPNHRPSSSWMKQYE